jgi:hypothetical protein
LIITKKKYPFIKGEYLDSMKIVVIAPASVPSPPPDYFRK